MSVLRLDPRVPMVWRSPTTLQIGVESPLVLDPVRPAEERLLAALRKGVPADSLAVQARCTAREAAALLGRLAPVLGTAAAPRPPSLVVRARDEQGRELGLLARQLGLLGTGATATVPSGPNGPAPGAAAADEPIARRGGIAVGAFAIPAAVYRDWLRDGLPHVGVILTETAAHVSHVVVPGRTPCLRCADLQRCDADAAWPVVAAQLIDCRAAAAEDRLVRIAAMTSAVRRLTEALGASTGSPPSPWALSGVRLDIGGGTTHLEARGHPECGCLVDLAAAARPAA